MSFFSLPDEMVSAMKEFEKNWSRPDAGNAAALPKEIASAVNLLAHPVAGFAAASAIGLGLASQAVGIWMGSLAGAMDAAQRMVSLGAEALPADPDAPGARSRPHSQEPSAASSKAPVAAPSEAPSEATTRAKAATVTLIADAKSLAREVADTGQDRRAAPAGPAAPRKAAAPAVSEPAVAEASAVPAGIAKPVFMDKPARPDDLKTISGIGPKLEQVLNGLGIWTFAQIAAWTPVEVAWVDDQLGFSGRIGRDDWIGQAAKLSGLSGAKRK